MSGEWHEIGFVDEPLARCDRCGRSTWSAAEVDREDRMPQPDGNPCGGRLVPTRRTMSPK